MEDAAGTAHPNAFCVSYGSDGRISVCTSAKEEDVGSTCISRESPQMNQDELPPSPRNDVALNGQDVRVHSSI